MKYLLDTHVVLWWLADPNKLSTKAKNIITDRNNKIYLSAVSVWEIAIKKDLAKVSVPINLLSILRSDYIEILPLHAEECLGIIDLPKIHSDPFDRAIIMQAKLNDLVLITKDQKIIQYPIITVKA